MTNDELAAIFRIANVTKAELEFADGRTFSFSTQTQTTAAWVPVPATEELLVAEAPEEIVEVSEPVGLRQIDTPSVNESVEAFEKRLYKTFMAVCERHGVGNTLLKERYVSYRVAHGMGRLLAENSFVSILSVFNTGRMSYLRFVEMCEIIGVNPKTLKAQEAIPPTPTPLPPPPSAIKTIPITLTSEWYTASDLAQITGFSCQGILHAARISGVHIEMKGRQRFINIRDFAEARRIREAKEYTSKNRFTGRPTQEIYGLLAKEIAKLTPQEV